jgi:pimeloyl-ACP methyl ester carboxylesterase
VPGVRHYDVVGFDPRGVALTTPSASCFESQFDRAAGWVMGRGMPSVLTDQGLRMRFGMNEAVGGLCERVELQGEKVFKYLTTASVARDMLEIVDRSHELVKGAGKSCDGEKPRLQYLGFSYGTLLGSAFASMFPGRVGRMVLDGVVDGDDYRSGVSVDCVLACAVMNANRHAGLGKEHHRRQHCGRHILPHLL